ncbi:MAG: hypothetical protein HWD59_05140 [Coxiellaceae bacterium]|nr:MAG: hypothetical protein HWD59_05140 [Coxiellaceae bacterium]
MIPKDLENPALKQQILVAKMNKDGSIKIMTLPNVGYMHIQTIQEANGNKRPSLSPIKAMPSIFIESHSKRRHHLLICQQQYLPLHQLHNHSN